MLNLVFIVGSDLGAVPVLFFFSYLIEGRIPLPNTRMTLVSCRPLIEIRNASYVYVRDELKFQIFMLFGFFGMFFGQVSLIQI